jgi:hypothetical protein
VDKVELFGLTCFVYTREFIGHPNDVFQEGFCPKRYLAYPALLLKGFNIYNARGIADFSDGRTSYSRAK